VAVVRLITDSGLLPPGSIQVVVGSPQGLLDQLTEQDTVGFTGSAGTAALLRTHPAVLHGGVRFGSEADSLNVSVLGVDATPDSPELDLFVRQLVTEMTAKTGQKCTAIRRALVPQDLVPHVVEAVKRRVAERVRVGDPRAEGVTMGALVGLGQRDDVRAAVDRLARAGRVVVGDPDTFEVHGADAAVGAFLPPLLLQADPDRSEPHEVEP